MIQTSFRNKRILDKIKLEEDEAVPGLDKLLLTNSEWADLADIESILQQVTVLNMNLQSDLPGKQSLTCYKIFATVEKLFKQTNLSFDVIDVNQRWKPGTPFNKIDRKNISENQLGTAVKLLLERLKKEFDNYITKIDSDMKVAAMVNPVTKVLGLG